MWFRLSIATAVDLVQLERLVVYDVDGQRHELSTSVGYTMIIISWVTFILSWLVNLLDYKFIHPSMPDTDLSRFPSKLVIYILGRRIDIVARWEGSCSVGDESEKSVIIPSNIEEDSTGGVKDVVIQMENSVTEVFCQ